MKLKEEQSILAKERSVLELAKDEFHKNAAIQKAELMQLKIDQENKETEAAERRGWLKQEIEKQHKDATELIAKLHARESNISLCEARVAQKESFIVEFEQNKNMIERNTRELHIHLSQAHEELEAEKKRLADRHKALQTFANMLDEKNIRLREKEDDIAKREEVIKFQENQMATGCGKDKGSANDLVNKTAHHISQGSAVEECSSSNNSFEYRNMKSEKAVRLNSVLHRPAFFSISVV
eukprot:Gb_31721 [translate_table: standard]